MNAVQETDQIVDVEPIAEAVALTVNQVESNQIQTVDPFAALKALEAEKQKLTEQQKQYREQLVEAGDQELLTIRNAYGEQIAELESKLEQAEEVIYEKYEGYGVFLNPNDEGGMVLNHSAVEVYEALKERGQVKAYQFAAEYYGMNAEKLKKLLKPYIAAGKVICQHIGYNGKALYKHWTIEAAD